MGDLLWHGNELSRRAPSVPEHLGPQAARAAHADPRVPPGEHVGVVARAMKPAPVGVHAILVAHADVLSRGRRSHPPCAVGERSCPPPATRARRTSASPCPWHDRGRRRTISGRSPAPAVPAGCARSWPPGWRNTPRDPTIRPAGRWPSTRCGRPGRARRQQGRQFLLALQVRPEARRLRRFRPPSGR